MCLIAFAWRQAGQRLLLLGNRDEFHARPTRPASFWNAEGHSEILAGKDLEAGGTWLGVTLDGRFAALTNIRAPGALPAARSRGELVAGFLASCETPEAYLARLASHSAEYAGFNLLVGDRQQLWYLNSQQGLPRELAPGYYGLSNAALDTPWPKLATLRSRLQQASTRPADELISLLGDARQYPDEQLPSTGVTQEWERALSAAFIVGDVYGTRASSVLRITDDDHVEFSERSFGPSAVCSGEKRYEFALQR